MGLPSLFGSLVYALLPGAVLVFRSKRGNFLEDLGAACTLSIGINSFVVLFLYLGGIYRPLTAWIWTALLVLGSVLVLLTGYKVPLRTRPANSNFQPSPLWETLVWLPLLLCVLYKSAFLPFFSYDAIASWNRWARDLVLVPQRIRDSDLFYPLFNSFGMSFPYMLSGDVTLEYYSHLLSFAHVLVLYAGLKQLARTLSFSTELVMAALFLSQFLFVYGGLGYSDIGATGYAIWALALYCQSLLGQRSEATAWIAGLAGACAYLFKQSVLPLLVLMPLLATPFASQGGIRWRFGLACRMAVGLVLAPVCWNLLGGYTLVSSQLTHVLSGIHGDAPLREVVRVGWENLLAGVTLYRSPPLDAFALALSGLLFLGCLASGKSVQRLLGVACVAHLAIWISTANYDVRAALLPLLVFGALSAAGLQALSVVLFPRYQVPFRLALVSVISLLAMRGEYIAQTPGSGWGTLDWRPGMQWSHARPWLSQEEKRGVLDPDLRDLEVWKETHPGFRGRFWSNPKLIAAFAPVATPEMRWLDRLDPEGKALRKEDHIFINRNQLAVAGAGLRGVAWQTWLRTMVAKGILAEDGMYGSHLSYEVVGTGGQSQ